MLFSHTPIRMEWFYSLEGYKTKFNWFLLEIALELYDRIRRSPELAWYRAQYDEKQIAQFCTYYTRRMKKSLLKHLRGRVKQIREPREIFDDFYPHHTQAQNDELRAVAIQAWESMWRGCENCPEGCLVDAMSPSGCFDEYASERKEEST